MIQIIHALMKDADDFDTLFLNRTKNEVAALGKTDIAGFDIGTLLTKARVRGEPV